MALTTYFPDNILLLKPGNIYVIAVASAIIMLVLIFVIFSKQRSHMKEEAFRF